MYVGRQVSHPARSQQLEVGFPCQALTRYGLGIQVLSSTTAGSTYIHMYLLPTTHVLLHRLMAYLTDRKFPFAALAKKYILV
jgi:hypothetical protein